MPFQSSQVACLGSMPTLPNPGVDRVYAPGIFNEKITSLEMWLSIP